MREIVFFSYWFDFDQWLKEQVELIRVRHHLEEVSVKNIIEPEVSVENSLVLLQLQQQ
jgi:hypothetical protein